MMKSILEISSFVRELIQMRAEGVPTEQVVTWIQNPVKFDELLSGENTPTKLFIEWVQSHGVEVDTDFFSWLLSNRNIFVEMPNADSRRQDYSVGVIYRCSLAGLEVWVQWSKAIASGFEQDGRSQDTAFVFAHKKFDPGYIQRLMKKLAQLRQEPVYYTCVSYQTSPQIANPN